MSKNQKTLFVNLLLAILLTVSCLTVLKNSNNQSTIAKVDSEIEKDSGKSELPETDNPLATDKSEEGDRHISLEKLEEATDPIHIILEVADVYRYASTDSEMVTQALQGEPVKVLSQHDSWVEITLPDQFNYHGWVQISALGIIPPRWKAANRKIVSVASAEVLERPQKDARVLRVLPLGTVVASYPMTKQGDFTSVQLIDGEQGFVWSKDMLDYQPQDTTLISRAEILTTARQLLGQPYFWGGMTTGGLDCSGFIHTVFKVHGVLLHRDADLQYSNDGVSVTSDELNPGDLVFFETYTKGASHLGIYVGNKKFIHASSSKGVSYASLDETYFSQRFIGAKRIVQQRPNNEEVKMNARK